MWTLAAHPLDRASDRQMARRDAGPSLVTMTRRWKAAHRCLLAARLDAAVLKSVRGGAALWAGSARRQQWEREVWSRVARLSRPNLAFGGVCFRERCGAGLRRCVCVGEAASGAPSDPW